ncbi:pirin family protein [Pontixanthobacter gangjinensis]|uniref:Pirin family protein n=1 Tax=Christiangramia aestuarii TaxID=1028746 RepID=A0A7K1LQ28_9FLAO|nr:pirin family protein [Christiangramia aestuarii]MUP42904.1 pirin family protein [Christiangramia aestuarii]
MRNIKKLHKAEYRPMGDLKTWSPLPTNRLQMIDPFIFLNHHGPQTYPPNNNGLPFGPHPHRGMETVTFILDGDIAHKDSDGHYSVIESGGVQWMTAGRGLLHAEVSSDEFKEKGGPLEILQLWINLPKRLKMTQPSYKGLQKDQISVWKNEDETVQAQVVSGNFKGIRGAFDTPTSVDLSLVYFEKDARIKLEIPKSHNIFFYVIRGKLEVNEIEVFELHLAEFSKNSEILDIVAQEQSVLLLGHAEPFEEKVVFGGPFVMNSEEEIRQAYEDYQAGKMGSWED